MCSKIREAKPFIHQMLDLIYDNIHLTNQQDINLLVLDAPDAVVLGRRTKLGTIEYKYSNIKMLV